MVKTRGLASQDQEPGAAPEAVAADILGVADAEQPSLEGAEMLPLSWQDFVGGGQCVDAMLRRVEEVGGISAGEEPGAQSSGDHGASESRVREEQTPNHPPPSALLMPGEGNSERWPLQDQEKLAPNCPSPSVPLSPEMKNSERWVSAAG